MESNNKKQKSIYFPVIKEYQIDEVMMKILKICPDASINTMKLGAGTILTIYIDNGLMKELFRLAHGEEGS